MKSNIINSNHNKYTIHVIDDSKTIIAALTATLEKEGYKVTFSMDGKNAIEDIHKNMPTLIVLDVEMPVMDGYQTIEELKKDKKTADIPVIFHTTLTKPEVVKKLFKIGASDYISKPFIPEELLARVEKEIRNITLQNQLKEKMSKLAEMLTTDPITRTSNRMHMNSIIKSKIQSLSKENKGSFSLIYIDIDAFNSFSKQHGISETERALKKFSDTLKKCIRDKDVLSHWGADVFVILLPMISNENLNKIAKTIRATVEKVQFASHSKLTCTISMLEISATDNIPDIMKTLSQRVQATKKLNKNSITMTNGRLLI